MFGAGFMPVTAWSAAVSASSGTSATVSRSQTAFSRDSRTFRRVEESEIGEGAGSYRVCADPDSVLRAGTNRASPSRMTVGIAGEEFLTPEIVLPIQFQRIWRGSATTIPERTLAMSVLCQAADDLLMYRYARRRSRQRLYMDAHSWVASNDRSWPYSFLNLCDALHLSPTCLRTELLGDVPCRRSTHVRGARRRMFRSGRIAGCERPSNLAGKPRVVVTVKR